VLAARLDGINASDLSLGPTMVTLERLSQLPVGAIVTLDGEEGEVIRAGREVWIMWPSAGVTNIIHTDSKAWQGFADWLEEEK
jgi:hypothetical protein